MGKDQGPSLRTYSTVSRTGPTLRSHSEQQRTIESLNAEGKKPFLPPWLRPHHFRGALIIFILVAGAAGYFYALSAVFGGKERVSEKPGLVAPNPVPVLPKVEPKSEPPREKIEALSKQADNASPATTGGAQQGTSSGRFDGKNLLTGQPEKDKLAVREGVVSVDVANVRERPDLGAFVMGQVERGGRVRITDERAGEDGSRWFRISLKYDREGWINQRLVVELRTGETIVREKPGLF